MWLLFGLFAGVGIENKHSTLLFGLAFFIGLLLTPERRYLRQPWIWLGALLAFVIFLPNLIWEIHRNFPTIELLRNVQRSGRNTALNPVMFVLQQMLIMHPLASPLWLAGLWYYFRDPEGRRFRILGWTYVVLLLFMLALNGRIYYLAPAYPMLFAAGGLAFQQLAEPRWEWAKPAYIAVLLSVT